MSINPKITKQLDRLGISLPADQEGSVIEVLCNLVVNKPKLSDEELVQRLNERGLDTTLEELRSKSLVARSALESAFVRGRGTQFNSSFKRQRDVLAAAGMKDADSWSEDELLEYSFEHGPRHSQGLRICDVVPLEHYSRVNPEVSSWWAEDSSHLYFLEENPDDQSDPYVTYLDSEELDGVPRGDKVRVSAFLTVLERSIE
ncbi:MAG: hypothetical protein AAF413_01350 [Patescibacteria group bacterium]